jgi:hypothetical protein
VKRRVLFVALLTVACNDDPYPNKSEVNTVRILAVRADLPYAHPGETVKLDALVVDGRTSPPVPMRMSWFPLLCVDPPGGQYYDCFEKLEAAYPIGVDITGELIAGDSTTITIPSDALANVTAQPGRTSAGEPLATAWSFMFACAGHVERIARSEHLGKNQPPFACFDDQHHRLGNEDGVFGFTRVTISQSRRNANPQMKAIEFEWKAVDPAVGIVTAKCDRGILEWLADDCDSITTSAAFDDAEAEIDPDNLGPDGKPARETLYSDWFVTIGRFEQDRHIEIDPFTGRPPLRDVLYEPWRVPGRGTVWVVLHDNRGGTSWLSMPITVE